ncbi:MAG TPA: MBL fold metallo-hydrolase [Gemmataceae bacterium]|nr:MBL fold metallo-hydrolase [Gemmataceae bacterium]
MPARFCVLASGSAGNSAFLQADGFGLLIDVGLGPRYLTARLAAIGASWRDVHAVILTHTHTDHWKDLSLGQMQAHRVPLYCADEHRPALDRPGGYFDRLHAAGLVRKFAAGQALELPGGLTCRSIPVPHDCDPTFAFRIDGPVGLFGPQWSVGYAADLGVAPPELIEAFADVNVLAIEFNHCEQMEQASGRPWFLIRRVLGDRGHLSNGQGADVVRAVARASAPGSLRHVIQLHLSRECNRPTLAAEHGRAALADSGSVAALTTARQDVASPVISLGDDYKRTRPAVVA